MRIRSLGKATAALAVPLLALPLLSQTQPGPVGPIVRTVDVTVTNIDVIVTDSKGNRVTGLKKEDFEVKEDGLDQPVTNFYAVEGGRVTFVGEEAIPTPVAAAPAPELETPAVQAPKTWIVLFIDNLSLQPFNRNRVLKDVQDFVKTSVKGNNVEAMIVVWNRSLKIRKKFTSDGRDLVDVLRQIEEESALGLSIVSERRDLIQALDDAKDEDSATQRVRLYAQSIDNDLKFTIEALKTTMNQLSGLDGRKIMIHVSDGLPQVPGAEMWKYVQDRFRSMGNMEQFSFDRTAEYGSVVAAANAAGVTMYTLDAAGLAVDSSVTAENRTSTARVDAFVERQNMQGMLSFMAEETGGKAILNQNDMKIPLKDIERDYTSYYSLGYRGLRAGADRPHKVEVKVKRKGLTVRARRNYVEKSQDTKIREAILSALYFPRDENPLGAGLASGTPQPADRQNYLVPVRIRIPYSRLTLLPDGEKLRGRFTLYVVVLDVTGNQSDLQTQEVPVEANAKDAELLAKRDFVYDLKLLMIPGGQKISIGIRDGITNTMSYLQKQIFISALPPEEPTKTKK